MYCILLFIARFDREVFARFDKALKGDSLNSMPCLVGEMSMEELVAKYAGAYDSDFEAEMSEQSTEIDSEDSDEEEEEEDTGIKLARSKTRKKVA